MTTPHDRSLDRSTADRIIQRAAELDAARAESLTEDQLRDIAAELSISRASLDQALAELRRDASRVDSVAPAAPVGGVRWYWRLGAGISLAFLLMVMFAMISRLWPSVNQ